MQVRWEPPAATGNEKGKLMKDTLVEEALDVLRPGLAADGFALKLGDVDPAGRVKIILEAGPEACLDCLVPDDIMARILEDAIREKGASVGHVEIVRVGFDEIAEH
jgi:hypothetical protein